MGLWSQDQRRCRGEPGIGERRIVQGRGVYNANLRLRQEGIIDLIALIIAVRHATQYTHSTICTHTGYNQVSIFECVGLVNEGQLVLVIECDGCGF